MNETINYYLKLAETANKTPSVENYFYGEDTVELMAEYIVIDIIQYLTWRLDQLRQIQHSPNSGIEPRDLEFCINVCVDNIEEIKNRFKLNDNAIQRNQL